MKDGTEYWSLYLSLTIPGYCTTTWRGPYIYYICHEAYLCRLFSTIDTSCLKLLHIWPSMFFPFCCSKKCTSASWLISPNVVLLSVVVCVWWIVSERRTHWWCDGDFTMSVYYHLQQFSVMGRCRQRPCTSGNLGGKGRGPRWWHKVCVNPLEWIIKGYSTWDYQTYYYMKSD